MSFLKYCATIPIFFLAEKFIISKGINCNFSLLLVIIFVINYFFPEENQKKINSKEIFPLGMFVLIGFIEDLFQGIVGPSIISKTITGLFLMLLIQQVFFHWNELLKGFIIFSLSVVDGFIYTFLIANILDLNLNYIITSKSILEGALLNTPVGLILTKGKP